jgi:hypothetical protein
VTTFLTGGLRHSDFGAGFFPELVQLIIIALEGAKNMDHHFAVVQQNPSRIRSALLMEQADTLLF